MNEKRCKDFVLAVANQLFDEVRSKLSCARFLTVLADGSTDATVVEQETVSVRYIHKGGPQDNVVQPCAVCKCGQCKDSKRKDDGRGSSGHPNSTFLCKE